MPPGWGRLIDDILCLQAGGDWRVRRLIEYCEGDHSVAEHSIIKISSRLEVFIIQNIRG